MKNQSIIIYHRNAGGVTHREELGFGDGPMFTPIIAREVLSLMHTFQKNATAAFMILVNGEHVCQYGETHTLIIEPRDLEIIHN